LFHVDSSAGEIKGGNRKSPPPRFAGVWALEYRVFSGRLESECTDARNLVAARTTAGSMNDLAILAHLNHFFIGIGRCQNEGYLRAIREMLVSDEFTGDQPFGDS
jgi:hypothetical protein